MVSYVIFVILMAFCIWCKAVFTVVVVVVGGSFFSVVAWRPVCAFAVSGVAIISASPAVIFSDSAVRPASWAVISPASVVGSWAAVPMRFGPHPPHVALGAQCFSLHCCLQDFFIQASEMAFSTTVVVFFVMHRAVALWMAVSTFATFDLDTFYILVYGWRCRCSCCYGYKLCSSLFFCFLVLLIPGF